MNRDTKKADEIWSNGHIHSFNSDEHHSSIAISDGRILAVGDDLEGLAGPGTKRTDLNGRFVMPGMIDTHTHGLWGSCRDCFEVYVGYTSTLDKLVTSVGVRAQQMEAGTWITGGPWRLDMRQGMGSSPKDLLDSIEPNHPVALKDTTQHSLWLNSKALALAGITATSAEVEGGVIERHPMTGEPNGILAENASSLVLPFLRFSDDQLKESLTYMIGYFHSMGITGFKEPMAYEHDLKTYLAFDQADKLNLHLGVHLSRFTPMAAGRTPYDELEEWREKYRSINIHTDFAKLFLDGVAPSHTASFFEPYLESSGYKAAAHDPEATLLLKPDDLAQEVTELDRRGFVVKMHAVGDRAVRAGLDAIEAARQTNGMNNLRHEIAHSPFVTDSDLPRFKELNAVAEMSPKLWFPNPVTAAQHAVLGVERTDKCHPIRTLLEAGAELIYGSDWPAAAPDANPWPGLAGMTTRANPMGEFPGTVGSDQAVSLEQALPLFTSNAARSIGLEAKTGSLEVGKSADFVILEKPLHEMSPEEIGTIEVTETWFRGKRVH